MPLCKFMLWLAGYGFICSNCYTADLALSKDSPSQLIRYLPFAGALFDLLQSGVLYMNLWESVSDPESLNNQ